MGHYDRAGREIIDHVGFLDLDLHEQEVLTWLVRCLLVHHGVSKMAVSSAAFSHGYSLDKGNIAPPLKTKHCKLFNSLKRLEELGFLGRETTRHGRDAGDAKRTLSLDVSNIEEAIEEAIARNRSRIIRGQHTYSP